MSILNPHKSPKMSPESQKNPNLLQFYPHCRHISHTLPPFSEENLHSRLKSALDFDRKPTFSNRENRLWQDFQSYLYVIELIMHPSNHLKNILKMGPEPSQNNPKFSLLFWTLLHPSLLQEQPAPSTSTTPASPPNYTYSPVCVLKSKPLSETVNSKLDTLCCAYSFSHDNNWVIAALTDSTGHLLDSAVFAVDEPAR